MHPWCLEELLKLSRLDIESARILYDMGYHSQAFFYMYQSLEKLIKALIVLGMPEEIKKKVESKITKLAEKGVKSFNEDDILCIEVMKTSVGHGAAWKLIEWMRNEYREIRDKISLTLSNKISNDDRFVITRLLEVLGINLEELSKFYEERAASYEILQKLVEDKCRNVMINERIVDLNKVFEELSDLSNVIIGIVDSINEEFTEDMNVDDIEQLLKTDVCSEFKKIDRGRKLLDLVRFLAEKQGSDPEEIVQKLCRALPCIYVLIMIILKNLAEIYKVFALIPFTAFLDRIKAYEFSRYPVSRNVSPLNIRKEHLDKIRFREISDLVINAIDSLENYLKALEHYSEFLSNCKNNR